MPEEANRRLTDHLSRLLFAHSTSALENLTREGIAPDRQHFVGNTMIDSVNRYLPAALDREPWNAFELEPGRYVLVTLHRPALVDDAEMLRGVIDALAQLAESLPVLFPVHPRTLARLNDGNVETKALRLCAPLGYLDFLGLEARAAFVLTDSGGIQEETSALGVRCFTLRNSTERPVTVELGTNTVIGSDPRGIARTRELVEADRPVQAIPLWDGSAGARVARHILEFIATKDR
jgi:UDP-N-acetylglucosamine 2-epimerase (non-hydrolysing)